MSQKPIDQRAMTPKPEGQDGVWAEIRKLRIFTAKEIHRNTGINEKTITDYLKRLMAGGYVEHHATHEATGRFKLVRDAGFQTPRIRKDGSPVQQGSANRNMWHAMRFTPTFTPRDLVALSNTDTASVTEATARTYCSMLLKAGYLRVIEKAKPGIRQATYKLIRNTGAQPPKVQRVKQVFDPNLNQVTYTPGGEA